jgi:hypothetical protein
MISLDDYVFTTGERMLAPQHRHCIALKCSPAPLEAHPLITQPNIKPGSQGFWYTRDEAKNQDLGVRERGTDAQLWTRYNMMQGFKAVRPGGSGRGEPRVWDFVVRDRLIEMEQAWAGHSLGQLECHRHLRWVTDQPRSSTRTGASTTGIDVTLAEPVCRWSMKLQEL